MKKVGRLFLGDFVDVRSIGRTLHKDERGDNENLGRLLILALVLVPLVVLIAFFGDKIWQQAKCKWDDVYAQDVGGKAVKEADAACKF